MKLYTEEQVKMMLDKMSLVTERKNLGVSANFRHRAIEIDNLIKLQTPIELPSDEEIKEIAIERFPISMEDFGSEKIDGNGYFRSIFIEGIECFRNKIQGGKNDSRGNNVHYPLRWLW